MNQPLPKDDGLPISPGTVIPRRKYSESNPGPYSLQQLAKQYTQEAMDGILDIARNDENGSTRLQAWAQILNRGWGKESIKVESKNITINVHEILKELGNQIKEPPKLVKEADVVDIEELGSDLQD